LENTHKGLTSQRKREIKLRGTQTAKFQTVAFPNLLILDLKRNQNSDLRLTKTPSPETGTPAFLSQIRTAITALGHTPE
jgi:hypothetical protein